MNADSAANRDRLQELAADHALFGLSDADRVEFEQLSQSHPSFEPEELERVAAFIELSAQHSLSATLPEPLARRILAAADKTIQTANMARSDVTSSTQAPHTWRRNAVAWLGWMVAAACFLFALLSWRQPAQPVATDFELRAQLIRDARDLVRTDWKATDHPAASGARGDVVWSESLQQGFMRFEGLAANVPSAQQYQLWIVDSDRDDPQPVDGGVFDIASRSGESIVPIRAKLPVGNATTFVVTIEKPGGVVVSKQQQVTLIAQVAANDRA